MQYPVLQQDVTFEEEIKKSRFITYLHRVQSLEEAKEYVISIAKQHPKARHTCWAVVAGASDDSQLWGFSDNGEPAGTAGRPMLNALVGSGIGEIVSVCVRYFGGVLLGTGGLVRAYGNGTQQALKLATTEIAVQRSRYRIVCNYEQLNLVIQTISHYDTIIINQDYGVDVTNDFELPPEAIADLRATLIDRSAGTIFVQDLD